MFKLKDFRFKSLALLAVSAVSLSACYLSTGYMRHETAKRIAAPSFMHEHHIKADPFVLTTFERVREEGSTANIYIEGDGLAWVSRQTPSLDPTPSNPVALHLAAFDNAKNVIYMGRPCQYTKKTESGPCEIKYWTSHRFAPEVIDSMNNALTSIKNRYDFEGFNLIGYSGGGAVATLLAAKRDDILTIRTVGGNLDHETVNRVHKVSQMPDSLNALHYAKDISTIPQHHFIGEIDEVITPEVYESYFYASQPEKCLRFSIVEDANHESGWVNIWPDLLELPLDCTLTHQPGTIIVNHVKHQ